MEIWPRLIDWTTFDEKQLGNDSREWTLPPEQAAPCDVGSMNVGVVDAFQLLQQNLSTEVRNALGTLVVSIATVEVDGWPRHVHAPLAVPGHAIYSPETVRRILTTFDSVKRERLVSEVKDAWKNMSDDPKDWNFVDADYWDYANSCDDFVDYLLGWRDAFVEAAEKDYGLLIDAG